MAPRKSLRLAELVAALSLATDLGLGQPMEYLLRSCVLSTRLADALNLTTAEKADVYYVALLRWIGCTGHAHEASLLFGDEIAARARLALIDMGRPGEVFVEAVRHAGEGRPPSMRLRTLAAALAAGPRQGAEMQFQASCEVAQLLARRLGFGDGVSVSLWHAFERWDGSGFPHRARGEAIPLPTRIVQLVQDAEVFMRVGGEDAAIRMARKRSGTAYDPAVVECFCQQVADLSLESDNSAWAAALAAEPQPYRTVAAEQIEGVLEVVADYVDLKSPFTAGHSRAVAALAGAAAPSCGLTVGEATTLRWAGLVHDLGRTGVPNSIWDKPGPLTDSEWERVRLHPYLTMRILSRPAGTAHLAEVAASHAERLDGSGYHRNLPALALSAGARVLAAADAYQAMREPRSYREALPREQVEQQLQAEIRRGRLDGAAVQAVLTAAGHTQRRRTWPADLTTREVEILRLLARGLPSKHIAGALVISDRTVHHHIQHIYNKLGVSTRGAAALFAMQHDLIGPVN
jgi:HD-GYP domain-containing protein (c-di-GMP phosphodiesterase class II)